MKFHTIRGLGLALVITTSPEVLAAQAPAPAAAVAPAAAPAAPDTTVVAKITADGKTTDVTLGKIRERKKSLPAQIQAAPEKEIFTPLRDSTVDMELITQAAKKAGRDKDPAVLAKIKNCEEATLQKDFLDAEIAAAAASTEGQAELKKVFDEVSKSLPKEDEFSLRHIMVKTEKEAADAIAKIKKGTDFATLAAEISLDDSKANGGSIGWVRQGEMPKEFADAVKGTAKATLVQKPVKTQLGYHVIKVDDKRPATPPTFDQVKPELIQAMAPKFAQKVIEKLRAAAKVEKFDMDGKPAVEEKKPEAAAAAAEAPKAEEKK